MDPRCKFNNPQLPWFDFFTAIQSETPMQKTRRQMLEEMLALEPNDAFLRYGLGMEFATESQVHKAVERLRALLSDQPEYVPAYFQAAQLLIGQEQSAPAAELLRAGIAKAQAQSNVHAAEEMSGLLSQLE